MTVFYRTRMSFNLQRERVYPFPRTIPGKALSLTWLGTTHPREWGTARDLVGYGGGALLTYALLSLDRYFY